MNQKERFFISCIKTTMRKRRSKRRMNRVRQLRRQRFLIMIAVRFRLFFVRQKKIKAKGEINMFNFGGSCCNDGGSELWSCLLNLIILFIVLEFLCNIISGNNSLSCGC